MMVDQHARSMALTDMLVELVSLFVISLSLFMLFVAVVGQTFLTSVNISTSAYCVLDPYVLVSSQTLMSASKLL